MNTVLNVSLLRIGPILFLMMIFSCDFLADSEKSEPPHISWEKIGDLDDQSIHSLESSPTGGIFGIVSARPGQGFVAVGSFDQGISWETLGLRLPIGFYGNLSINSIGVIFISNSGSIYRSTDNGNNWDLVRGETYALILAEEDSLVFTVGSFEIFRSENNGDTWVITESTPRITYSIFVSILLTQSHQLFLGTSLSGVYKSSDYGDSWTHIPDLGEITARALLLGLGGELYASGSNLLYKSDDDGKRWRQISKQDDSICCLDVNSNGDVFLATWYGVFRSFDQGRTWERLSDGFPELVGDIYGKPISMITSMTIDPAGYVYYGTHGAGLFRSSKPTTY